MGGMKSEKKNAFLASMGLNGVVCVAYYREKVYVQPEVLSGDYAWWSRTWSLVSHNLSFVLYRVYHLG